MKYEPRPDTVAFRVLAHMALLHKGSEISTSLLGAALNVDPNGLTTQLQGAVDARLLYRRQRGGHIRSPIFWSLVDHGAEEHAAPSPGPQAPIRIQQTFAAGTSRKTVDQVASANLHRIASSPSEGDGSMSSLLRMVKDLSRPALGPTCDHGEPIDGDCAQCHDEIQDAGGTTAEIVVAEPPPSIEEPKPEVLSPRAVLNGLAEAYCFDATPPAVARQLMPDNATDIRIALWSDGTLEIRAFEAPTMLLTRNQARQLVDYLNAIDLDVLEDEVAR